MTCIITNCRKFAPAGEPFCHEHRDKSEERSATSCEIMVAGGVNPDAPFDVGPFPPQMRQLPPASQHYLADRFEWAAPGDQQEDAWILRFCDQDMREAVFTGPDAEKEAWEHWERYAPAWNCFLFRLVRLRPSAAGEA